VSVIRELGRLRRIVVCAFVLSFSCACPAWAAERWTTAIEVASTLPLDVGERVSLEAPNRLHIRASLGVMPGVYADWINDAVVAFGGYSEHEALAVRRALGKSLVFRVQGGFRPFSNLGLYFDVGYSRMQLTGALTGTDVLLLGQGAIPPQDSTSPLRHYEVSSTLHLVILEIGWEQPVLDWLFVRGALGFAGTEGASSRIKPLFSPSDARYVQTYCDLAADYLDGLYAKYVYGPTLTLGAGVRF
jgi:hypothetical protein